MTTTPRPRDVVGKWGLLALLIVLLACPACPAQAAAPAPARLEPDPDWWPNAALFESGTGRDHIVYFEVRPGDSLWGIAADFDLDVDSVRYANPELIHNPDLLRPGQVLVILPIPGAYVTAQAGETLAALADRWGVPPTDISNYPLNYLRPGEEPRAGAKLIIPYGRREVNLAPPGPATGSTYAWPIRGTVTQGYSAAHRAVDFGAPYGAKVYASRAGRCVYADWSPEGLYGYLVIIDHGDGSRAYYSHLKGAWVEAGDWAPRGATGRRGGQHRQFDRAARSF